MVPVKPASIEGRGPKGPTDPSFSALGAAGAAPLLELAASDQTNGQLEVEGPWALTACLTVRFGKVIDAVSGQLRGDAAAMRVFLWSEARYRWRSPADLVSAAIQVTVTLDNQNLITEGLRQRAVWQRILRDLPSLAARFEVDFSRPALRVSDLPSAAHALCRLCDGHRALGEVLRDSALPDLEAVSILGHLIGQGILTRATERHRPIGPATSDEPPAIGDAGCEQTDLTSPARPRSSRPWPLVALGLGLGIGGALLLSTAKARPPGPTRVAPPSISHSLHSNTEHIANPTNISSAPQPPPPAAALPVTPPADLSACQRARSLGEARRILAACERLAGQAGVAPDLLALLARLELERGAFAKAATRARRAIALDPNLPEAYAYLGFAEAEAGRRREAMAAYRRYLALAPRGSFAEDVRAIVHEDRGR